MAERNPFQEFTIPNITSSQQRLQTTVIQLHYNDAVNVAKLLTEKNSHFLSSAGHISVDKKANSLWIQDTSRNIHQLQQLIKKIDKPTPQIQIEARIVNIDENFTQELGIEFGTVKADSGNNIGGLNMDMPLRTTGAGHFNFTLAKLGNNNFLDMELSALESEGHAKIISKPKLITLNRKSAHIAAGEDIPYQEKTGEGNTSTTFKQAVLSLDVTPNIVSKNKILLNIRVNQDQVSALEVNGVPAIKTREIQTQAIVNNKQTVVIGGIYEQSKINSVTKIPILGDIPFIGFFFRSTKVQNERKELLIFITPEIVS